MYTLLYEKGVSMDNHIKGLFPITQAADACGLSRSTLMRMEEKGLLTPAYIAPKSKRRYYDNHNISRILQIQQFQSMGFDAEETAAYFTQGGEAWLTRGREAKDLPILLQP